MSEGHQQHRSSSRRSSRSSSDGQESSRSPTSSTASSGLLDESPPHSPSSSAQWGQLSQDDGWQGAASSGSTEMSSSTSSDWSRMEPSTSSLGTSAGSSSRDTLDSSVTSSDFGISGQDAGQIKDTVEISLRAPLVREDSATREAMTQVGQGDPTESPPHERIADLEGGRGTRQMLDSGTGGIDTTDFADEAAPHEPKTAETAEDQPTTVPTVSATGMPRIFGRDTDDPSKQDQIGSSSHQDPPPPELMPEGSRPEEQQQRRPRRRRRSSSRSSSSSVSSAAHSSVSSSLLSQDDQVSYPKPPFLQALTPSSGMPMRQRIWVVSSSFLLNLGLPVLNGVFLGFGEIFARSLVAPVVLAIVEHRLPELGRWRLGNGAGVAARSTVAEKEDYRRRGGSTPSVEEQRRIARDAGTGRGIGTSGLGLTAAPPS